MTTRSQAYANLALPVPAGTAGASLLATCDPTLAGLVTAFSAILTTKLNAAWVAAANGLAGDGTSTPAVVVATYTVDPTRGMAQRGGWSWPALALWRESEKWTQRTAGWDSCESVVWGAYVLPPLTQEYRERLSHVRHAVVATLRGFIEAHGDPTYASGADFLANLNVEWLWLSEVTYGAFEALGTDLEHPAVRFKLDLRERQLPVLTDGNIQTLSRIDTTVQEADATLGNLTTVQTQFDPTTA